MGIRFRKSFKIAPGIKLNLNKKSAGITLGTRGAHYTLNSKGTRTSSVGIPGTGLSYTETSGGTKNTKSTTQSNSSNSSKGGNGCLGILLILFLIFLAIYLYSFAWIPSLIFVIYLAMSKKFERKKKIIYISIAALVCITSLALFGTMDSEPELTDMNVSISKEEYDINDTAEVELTLTPSDAIIEKLEISENEIVKLDYSNDQAIISFKSEGTATIYFIANGSIESNSIEITVTDKESEVSGEIKEPNEETIVSEVQTDEDVSIDDSQSEPDAPSSETIQEDTSNNSQGDTSSNVQQNTPVVVPDEPVQTEPETSTDSSSQETMVWISENGTKYHSHSGCSGMKSPTQVTKEEAEDDGKEPCKKCY